MSPRAQSRAGGCIPTCSSGSIDRCPLVRRAHGRGDRRSSIRRCATAFAMSEARPCAGCPVPYFTDVIRHADLRYRPDSPVRPAAASRRRLFPRNLPCGRFGRASGRRRATRRVDRDLLPVVRRRVFVVAPDPLRRSLAFLRGRPDRSVGARRARRADDPPPRQPAHASGHRVPGGRAGRELVRRAARCRSMSRSSAARWRRASSSRNSNWPTRPRWPPRFPTTRNTSGSLPSAPTCDCHGRARSPCRWCVFRAVAAKPV